jgi:hypothetical protein
MHTCSYRKSIEAQGNILTSSRSADPSRSLSQREQEQELIRANQVYNCNIMLDKDLSEKVRNIGLENKLTTCDMAKKLIRDGVIRARDV